MAVSYFADSFAQQFFSSKNRVTLVLTLLCGALVGMATITTPAEATTSAARLVPQKGQRIALSCESERGRSVNVTSEIYAADKALPLKRYQDRTSRRHGVLKRTLPRRLPENGLILVRSDDHSTLRCSLIYKSSGASRGVLDRQELQPIATLSDPDGVACVRADLNRDGSINGADLTILLRAFGTSSDEADINSDGQVSGADLSMLIGCFGPAAAAGSSSSSSSSSVSSSAGSSAAGSILRPGAGFSSPQTGEGCGNHSDAAPCAIARWDVVPHQAFTGDFRAGVIAFHKSGIQRVEFQVNGGAPLSVTQLSLNPQTQVWEYWVRLSSADFAGPNAALELRATAYPINGTPRRLPPLVLYANPQSAARWVSPAGNDANTGQSAQSPVKTVQRALQLIRDAQGGTIQGGTVNLLPGNYSAVGCGYDGGLPWLTIQAAPEVPANQRESVRLIAGGDARLPSSAVRLRNITLDKIGIEGCGSGRPNIWFDNAHLIGSGSSIFYYASNLGAIYATDGTRVENAQDAIKSAVLQRGVEVRNILSDAFTDTQMIVNCYASGVDTTGSTLHPDILQFNGDYSGNLILKENLIVYGLQAYDSDAQGIFARDIRYLKDIAFVNVMIERDRALNPSAAGVSQILGADINHLLMWNVSTNAAFNIADDAGRGWQTTGRNVSIVGNVVEAMSIGATGAEFGAEIAHNHFLVNGPAIPSSDSSTGVGGVWTDPSANLFTPQSTLRGRVQRVTVPIDALNRQRTLPAAIGAFE